MKKLVLIAAILAVILKFLPQEENKPVAPHAKVKKSTIDLTPVAAPPAAAPVVHTFKLKKGLPASSRQPSSEKKTISRLVELPGGLAVIADHYALLKKDYSPDKGEIVSERHETVVIRSDHRPDEASNVVFDEKNDRYFPVSAVVKVSGVNEKMREKILGMGIEEHYYHQALRVMYLQSTHEKLLALYDELTEMKLQTELEIIRGPHLPR